MYRLLIHDDAGQQRSVQFELGTATIGRAPDNTVRLDERNISRRHAQLSRQDGAVVIEDLDSFNGVWVNAERITGRATIKSGDAITIGDFVLRLEGEGMLVGVDETTQRSDPFTRAETTQPGAPAPAPSAVDEPTMPGIPLPAPPGPVVADSEPELLDGDEITPLGGVTPAAGILPPPAGPDEHTDPNRERRDEPTNITRTADDDEPGPRSEPTALIRLEDLEAKVAPAPLAGPGREARLVVVTTNLAGTEYRVRGPEVVLGREAQGSDVHVDHRSVSRHHAKIIVHGGGYSIVDLKSANGVFVNGEQYAKIDLNDGDLVELGHVKMRFIPPDGVYALDQQELLAIKAARGGKGGDDTHTEIAASHGSRLGSMLAGGLIMLVLVLIIAGLGWFVIRRSLSVAPIAGGAAVTPVTPAVVPPPPELPPSQPQPKPEPAPEDPDQALLAAAVALADKGRFDAAREKLGGISPDAPLAGKANEQLARIQAKELDGKLREGQRLLKRKELEQAQAVLAAMEAIDASAPQVSELQQALDDAESKTKPAGKDKGGKKRKKLDEAPPKEAGGIAERDPAKLYQEGGRQLMMGKFTEALAYLARCVQVDPKYCNCHRGLGITYSRLRKSPQAIKSLKAYLTCAPEARDVPSVKKMISDLEAP